MGVTAREYVLCPHCKGGDRNRKVEFRQGSVGTYASEAKEGDECDVCKGDGIIVRPDPPPVVAQDLG